jgi:lipoprotein-anchoring transpeptidase ErfK/SrfK
MKCLKFFLSSIAAIILSASAADAGERYQARPPVMVSPDLSAPWVMQLQNGQARRTKPAPALRRLNREVLVQPSRQRQRKSAMQTASVKRTQREVRPAMDPQYLPQQVAYDGGQPAGTIVIDTNQKFLYLVQGNGEARRYGVGVGLEGMVWTGTQNVSRKAQWPDWRPPSEMIVRERAKGRHLPSFMPGGPENPLGARALYLGSTLYRIHGTNAPWTIGTNVSSGCIRLRNEDVVDLYERVDVGTKVVVM